MSTSSLNVDHLGKPPDPPQQPLPTPPAPFPLYSLLSLNLRLPSTPSPLFLQAGNALELVLGPKLCNGFFVLCAFNWSFCCCCYSLLLPLLLFVTLLSPQLVVVVAVVVSIIVVVCLAVYKCALN